MYVTLNQQPHSLRFQHGTDSDGRDYTNFYLSAYNAESPKDSVHVATATVVRHHLDAPCREHARKAAIEKALRATALSKEDRRAIWTAYLNRRTVTAVAGTPKPAKSALHSLIADIAERFM